MCGISGIVLKNASSLNLKDSVFRMSQSIKHRGPDGEGFLFASEQACTPVASKDTETSKGGQLNYLPQKNIDELDHSYQLALAHRRLSIIDLTDSGHQPMANKEGKIWITFNGEIYNYLELKKELESLGHQFISTSDTEVIIHAYQEWDTECLDKFNGMWSFCIYDCDKKRLFCSRDRFGVKPFYYTNTDKCFAFASEQKALIKGGIIKAEIDERALHDYFINNRIEAEETNFFKDINELRPGHYLIYELQDHSLETIPYYKLDPDYDYKTDLISDKELISEVREALTSAVNLRLRSDVPVGSCLSGGIDSSALAVLMSGHQKDPVYFFTSVFKNDPADESHYAELVAKKVNGIYKTSEPTEAGLMSELETLVYSQDVPIWDTSTYAQFKVMELAKQNKIKVVLDGQGADELFAGYHHHFVAKWNYYFSYGNVFKLISELNKSKKTIASPYKLFLKEKLKSLHNSHLAAIDQYFKKEFVNSDKVINPVKYFDSVNDQLAFDIEKARLKAFLKCEDRCGMWHSVESRTPFSDDIDLIRLMFSINGNRKIQNGTSKFFLREALKDKLPAEIYSRYDKKGFETPMAKWIGNNQKQIFEMVESHKLPFVNLDTLKKTFSDKAQTPKEVTLLFKFYVYCLWKKSFSVS
jgi:asparagine synthase (glutamine-hydrolysing)